MHHKEIITELVRKGDEILRISLPHKRQKSWLQWRNQVKQLMKDINDLRSIGLQLSLRSLAKDVGMLSRYDRMLEKQIDVGPQVIGPINEIERNPIKETILSQEPITIFISHKHEDERTARGIKSVLERYGAGKVEIIISEDMPKGIRWIDWIRERLSEANILLLLFTDATKTWDWCLYETGLFTKLEDPDRRPIICLHGAHLTPPEPILHLNAVPAEEKQVRIFLKQFFVEAKIKGMSHPISGALAEQPEELERAAKEIVSLVSRTPVKSDFFSKYLYLNIRIPEEEKIPEDSDVISDRSSLEIFGLTKGDWKWKDIVTEASRLKDHRWIEQLNLAVSLAITGKLFEPIQAALPAIKGGKFYRPILYRVDTLAEGSKVCKILFIEDVSWNVTNIPPKQAILITALLMAIRFRYEILKKLDDIISESDEGNFKKETLDEILQLWKNIESEASSRGFVNQEFLLQVFEKEHIRPQIYKMYKKWYQIKDKIFDVHNEIDLYSLQEMTAELITMTQSFLKIGSMRLSELFEAQ